MPTAPPAYCRQSCVAVPRVPLPPMHIRSELSSFDPDSPRHPHLKNTQSLCARPSRGDSGFAGRFANTSCRLPECTVAAMLGAATFGRDGVGHCVGAFAAQRGGLEVVGATPLSVTGMGPPPPSRRLCWANRPTPRQMTAFSSDLVCEPWQWACGTSQFLDTGFCDQVLLVATSWGQVRALAQVVAASRVQGCVSLAGAIGALRRFADEAAQSDMCPFGCGESHMFVCLLAPAWP